MNTYLFEFDFNSHKLTDIKWLIATKSTRTEPKVINIGGNVNKLYAKVYHFSREEALTFYINNPIY